MPLFGEFLSCSTSTPLLRQEFCWDAVYIGAGGFIVAVIDVAASCGVAVVVSNHFSYENKTAHSNQLFVFISLSPLIPDRLITSTTTILANITPTTITLTLSSDSNVPMRVVFIQ